MRLIRRSPLYSREISTPTTVEWLNSISPTNSQGKGAKDFGSNSGCIQIVNFPTHVAGNCLDPVFTNVPGSVCVSVYHLWVGISDHFVISFKITTTILTQNETFFSVFLKLSVNLDLVLDDLYSSNCSTVFQSINPTLNWKKYSLNH